MTSIHVTVNHDDGNSLYSGSLHDDTEAIGYSATEDTPLREIGGEIATTKLNKSRNVRIIFELLTLHMQVPNYCGSTK